MCVDRIVHHPPHPSPGWLRCTHPAHPTPPQATTADLYSVCVDRMLRPDVDLVIVEFALSAGIGGCCVWGGAGGWGCSKGGLVGAAWGGDRWRRLVPGPQSGPWTPPLYLALLGIVE